ncbi:hypothetical protein [Erythrobacter sp. MTPC3]|uniref:hypothetical protein n=1 Tax=Erythrobacter sp. MTPC3 TaxID=3056564 RepID=UPI0036F34791
MTSIATVDRDRSKSRFVIPVTSYHEEIGGVIVLHKLCHFLNELGYEAYLYPVLKPDYVFARRLFANISSRLPLVNAFLGKGYVVNKTMMTPLLPLTLSPSDGRTIAIYSDTIGGNPMGAPNVVRFFLHKPGFHSGECEFGSNELHVDFNEFLNDYDPGLNQLSPNKLFVLHFPFEIYNLNGAVAPECRSGTAYCVRKGKVDERLIDLDGSICIDGLSHLECAAVLKRVKYFVSFDPYTAFSSFAALCGAISIVSPPAGMTKADWYQDEEARFGIAFGFDETDWALSTRGKVRAYLERKHEESRAAAERFAFEAEEFFGLS